MDSSSSNKAIPEKTNQVPLKCPRCGSCNTKFCYYNNYSLSQPRHFCRACKRYWTRGGTLRNVPVGGGCRKNKKGKRCHDDSAAGGISSPVITPPANPSFRHHLDLRNSSSYVDNPFLYRLPTNPIELNFPISGANSARVCSDHTGFDQNNGSGLGFSSSTLMATDNYQNGDHGSGFKQIQEVTPPPFSISGDNGATFVESTGFAYSSSTMACLLASGIQQPKSSTGGLKDILPNQIPNSKEAKLDAVWNPSQQIITSSDHSWVPWNTTTSFGAWIDPSTLGSSLPSLI